MMLTTNLSTRPFYNVRAVRGALACVAVILAVLSALHLLWALSLRDRERGLTARATDASAEAARLRTEARVMRAQVDPQEIALMSDAAREANDVIELRAFSWGTLLTQLERTLPDDVRVTSIRPRVEERTIVLQLDVESQSDEALSAFMDGLERTGSFRNMLPTRRQWADDDVIDAVIEGIYSPNAPVSEATAERRGSEARP